MALTETPSSWQIAAQAGQGPGLGSLRALGGAPTGEAQPVHAALASATSLQFDMEGTPELGAISPRVRQWRADLGTGAPPARPNRWAEVR